MLNPLAVNAVYIWSFWYSATEYPISTECIWSVNSVGLLFIDVSIERVLPETKLPVLSILIFDNELVACCWGPKLTLPSVLSPPWVLI